MKHLLLFFIICFIGLELPAQVKTRPLPTEQKSDAKVADDQSMSIYPNPSTGVINVSLQGFEGKKTDLLIMNVIGNVVHREVIHDTDTRNMKTMDLSKFPKGLYYVKLETATYSEVRKVILR